MERDLKIICPPLRYVTDMRCEMALIITFLTLSIVLYVVVVENTQLKHALTCLCKTRKSFSNYFAQQRYRRKVVPGKREPSVRAQECRRSDRG